MFFHDEKIYEKNLMVMSIKVVVGLLLCSEDIDIFLRFWTYKDRKVRHFTSIVILLEKYIVV